jgi:carnitine-CoA ligase
MNQKNLYEITSWTVDQVLDHKSRTIPETVFVVTAEGSLTYREAWSRSQQVANMLEDIGIGTGDPVAVMLPNGMAFCDSWLGLSRLGAILVAINTDYGGRFLEHVLNDCRARAMVVSVSWLERIEAIKPRLEHIEQILVVGETAGSVSFQSRQFSDWTNYPPHRTAPGPSYRDTGCVMYTSGTTGPSKGVMMPHAHLYLFGLGTIEHMELDADDVFYIVLPMFHANALFMQLYATMIAGARAVIRDRFSAGNWIGDIVEHGATATNSLGAVAAFVLNQPPSDLDRNHRLRAMGLAPSSEDLVQRLKDRFAIPMLFGLYGMTEVNIPLYTPPGAPKGASCGRLWDRFYDLRIVDPDSDEELPRRHTGEIVVRPRQPYGFMSGYLNMPDKTLEAWRNFWFHTGDAAWMDEEGDVFFVDRIKDCIRRRGENISSYEVEIHIATHPDVREVAAYGVDSDIDGAEDEVMVALVVDSHTPHRIESIRDHASEGLPRFAVPRYYRIVQSLPKTPTGKVQKHVLRSQGLTDDTVDLG